MTFHAALQHLESSTFPKDDSNLLRRPKYQGYCSLQSIVVIRGAVI